jgi:uncharacterized membrane protein
LTRRAPIAIVLCLQACLLFWALDLLPIWTDELFTLKTVAHPVSEILPIVQRDIHPPLYFVLLHGWTRLPLPWTGIAGLRAFSAVWALLATLLLDLFWTREWEPFGHWIGLSLFAFSPCLLLYGRMARSYTMQVALVVLALGLLRHWMRSPRSWLAASGAAAAILCLLYTHYLPAVALLAGFALIAWRSVGEARAGIFLLAITAGYFPWILALSQALHRWRDANNFSSTYTLTGNAALEQFVKFGFGLVSLTIGESFYAVSLLLSPVILTLAILGARRAPFSRHLALTLVVAAVAGYLGVSRWVSYPFIPARLLWLLPFLILAVSQGILHLKRPMIQRIIVVAVALSYLSSCVLYFRRENYLNLGYAAPLPEIAAMLNRDAQPGDVVLVDSYNTDFQALAMYLSGRTPMIALDRISAAPARKTAHSAGTIWIVRNTRDISPGGLTPGIRSEVCAGRPQQRTLLEPYAQWQKVALSIAGFQPPPTHFYEVTACGPAAAEIEK